MLFRSGIASMFLLPMVRASEENFNPGLPGQTSMVLSVSDLLEGIVFSSIGGCGGSVGVLRGSDDSDDWALSRGSDDSDDGALFVPTKSELPPRHSGGGY